MANPKKNTYLQLQEAYREIERLKRELELEKAQTNVMRGVTVRQCIDASQLALNNRYHFGEKRNDQFEQDFWEYFSFCVFMCVDDGKDDPNIVYATGKLDRMMKKALGKNFKPFNERYSLENIMLREKLVGGKGDD